MSDVRKVFKFLADERRRKKRCYAWQNYFCWISLGVAWLVAIFLVLEFPKWLMSK